MEILNNINTIILTITCLAILLIGAVIPFTIKWIFRYWVCKKILELIKNETTKKL